MSKKKNPFHARKHRRNKNNEKPAYSLQTLPKKSISPNNSYTPQIINPEIKAEWLINSLQKDYELYLKHKKNPSYEKNILTQIERNLNKLEKTIEQIPSKEIRTSMDVEYKSITTTLKSEGFFKDLSAYVDLMKSKGREKNPSTNHFPRNYFG